MIRIIFVILLFFLQWQSVSAQPFRAVNLQKDTINCFSGTGKTIFILANIYSCSDCFKHLNVALKSSYFQNDKTSIIIFCHPSTSASSERRRMLNQMKSLFPIANNILFELQEEEETIPPTNSNVFSTFSIDYTPALLVWDNTQRKPLLVLKYKSLFDNKGQVLANVLPKIIDALK